MTLCELLLRWVLPAPQRSIRFDERTIYELIPGSTRTFTRLEENGGETISIRINSDGFRGPPLRDDAPCRVVVYGDSYVQAEYSSEEDSFTGRLGTELASRRPELEIEVINAGVIGYGPGQILRKMEDELASLQPNLVLVTLFADNDFGDLLRSKLFELDDAGRLVENPTRLSPSLRRSLGLDRDLALVTLARKAYWRWLAWREANAAGVDDDPDNEAPDLQAIVDTRRVNEWLEKSRSDYRRFVEEHDRVVRQIYFDHYDADLALDPDGESSRYKTRLLARVLERIAALGASQGTEIRVIVVPSPIDLCADYPFQVDRDLHPAYEPRRLSESAEEATRRAGLPIVSLWDVFEAHGPEELYFRHHDNHWNDLGQKVAARAAADAVESSLAGLCQPLSLIDAPSDRPNSHSSNH